MSAEGPTALILGGAGSVLDEARAALMLFAPDAILAINDTIPLWPGRLDYIATLHPNKVDGWLKARAKNGHPMGAEVWSHKQKQSGLGPSKVDQFIGDWGGSSGLFSVRVLRHEGFTRIVLAGVPVSIEAGHIVRQKPWNAAKHYWKGWTKHKSEIAPFVRSMSGWTKELLGAPDKHWLGQ